MTILAHIRTHLLISTLFAYISGILFAHYCSFNSPPLSLILPTAAVLLLSFSLKKINLSLILLLALFLQTGLVAGKTILSPPKDPHHIANIIEESSESVVIATIRRIYDHDQTTTRFDAEAISLRQKNSSYQTTTGIIRYTLNSDSLPDAILPGHTVAIRSFLKPPSSNTAGGGFDYSRHLALQHIWITGYIPSPLYIQKVKTEGSGPGSLLLATELLREKIKDFIDGHLTGDSAALYKALITGDRSSIEPDLLEYFKGSGCMHILAISGIHMSILGLLLFFLFFWVLRRSQWIILNINTKKTAAVLCVLPLILYALIAGSNTPVMRSLLMSLVAITAVCSDRQKSFFTLVAWAAFALLVYSPQNLFSPSFQLSFAAVISIAATAPFLRVFHQVQTETLPPLQRYLVRSRAWLLSAFCVSLAATLGTAPLVIVYFNRLSLVGPLANIVVEPLICLWSLTIGFVATLFIFLSPAIASFLLNIGELGLILAVKSVTFFNGFTFSSIRLPTPSITLIACYYLGMLLLLYSRHSCRRVSFPALALTLAAAVLFFLPPAEVGKYWNKESTLVLFDVGQGSSSLVELPKGKRILIDGGAVSSPQFNVGERVIAPYLWHKGITRIDEVVITHPDSDHYNGIPFILEHFGVKNLWINGFPEKDPSWQQLLAVAEKKGVHIHTPSQQTPIACSGGACVEVLANTAAPAEKTLFRSKNDQSLILKFSHGQFSAIFPGDISSQIEKELVQQGLIPSASLLLAAHHGSVTSNSETFLQAVSPQYLVVSASPYRSQHFPAPALSAKCAEHGITMLLTTSSGTITVKANADTYVLETTLRPQSEAQPKPRLTSDFGEI